MIYISISQGFSKDNRYELNFTPQSIQLALYKYDLYIENRDYILHYLDVYKPTIRVVHLPIDGLRYDDQAMLDIITFFRQKYSCKKFVIHPNKGIEDFVRQFANFRNDVKLCIENFQYRKKKRYRTPLDIIDVCIRNPQIRMTLDTSHTDDIWFDHKVLPYILKHTSVIHLSNRNRREQHIPFNSPNGELNLVSFVKNLRYRYKWNGDIVLEYLGQYTNKLQKNMYYIKSLLEE